MTHPQQSKSIILPLFVIGALLLLTVITYHTFPPLIALAFGIIAATVGAFLGYYHLKTQGFHN